MPSAVIPMPGPRTPADLRRRALARLAERFDPLRLRHKPLSLVRADARRQADQFLDSEAPALTRTERDRLAEDVVAALPGAGPLEELFRDEAVAEILVLGPTAVIVQRGGAWAPTSARFRDADQLRAVVGRYAEVGEPTVPGQPAVGAVDVRLPGGFRLLAVVPPAVLEVPPTLHLTRCAAAAPGGRADVLTTPAPVGGSRAGSGVIPRSVLLPRTARPSPPPDPEVVSLAASAPPASAVGGSMGSASGRLTSASGISDPFARLKTRMTEKIIMRLASAGVYDLNQVPLPELRKFITLAVGEYCQQEGVESDPEFQQRLGLEILAAMNR